MTIFPSLKRFTVFFSMELLIGYLKTYPLEGGQMGKGTYGIGGVVANAHVRTMGKGVTFLLFWCVCTN